MSNPNTIFLEVFKCRGRVDRYAKRASTYWVLADRSGYPYAWARTRREAVREGIEAFLQYDPWALRRDIVVYARSGKRVHP